MNTYTQIIYQVVFSTEKRTKCIVEETKSEVFKYISGILRNNKCHLFQINGVYEHIHILLKLHPSVALSNLIKDVKIGSNKFIKEKKLFPHFPGWQDGYGAFTYAHESLPNLIHYIQNQEIHHGLQTFEEELISLMKEHGIEYDEKYLFD